MLYGGLDLQTAKMGKSNCRNEAIAEAFHYMHIAEAWGTGLPRIINRCKAYGLPDPLFEEFGDGFKATVYRKAGNDSEKVGNAPQKVGNALQNIGNEPEKVGNDFEKYTDILKKSGISDVFIRNIEQVYCECGMGVVFGQTNVMVWLNCSKAKATNVMNAMKKAEIVKKVSGLGPGKYEFVEM